MFNKQPKHITNNYHNVFRSTTEIDYEKLAKAIVKAQQEVEEQKQIEKLQEENNKVKISTSQMCKLIWAVITNKAESNGTLTSSFIGSVLSSTFNLIALFGVVVFGLGIFATVIIIKGFDWTINSMPSNIIMITFYVSFELVVAMIAFIFRCIANEIAKEKDRNYIINVFSAVVAFAAMIVAVAGYAKGII